MINTGFIIFEKMVAVLTLGTATILTLVTVILEDDSLFLAVIKTLVAGFIVGVVGAVINTIINL